MNSRNAALAATARGAGVGGHVVARAQRFVADGDDHDLRVHRLDDVDQGLEARLAVEQVDRRQVRAGSRPCRAADRWRAGRSCRCSATRSFSSASTRPSPAGQRRTRLPPPPQPAVTRPSNATREERRVTVIWSCRASAFRRRRVTGRRSAQDRRGRPSGGGGRGRPGFRDVSWPPRGEEAALSVTWQCAYLAVGQRDRAICTSSIPGVMSQRRACGWRVRAADGVVGPGRRGAGDLDHRVDATDHD